MEDKKLQVEQVSQNLKETEQRKAKPELSEEAIRERAFLSGLLIQQTEDLTKEAQKRKKKREEELIELRSGVKISIAQINAIVTASKQPYSPKFPNDVPFYKELYRLNNWGHLDPTSFNKPSVVADWTKEIIYGRFGKDVLPSLLTLNPLLSHGFRLYKLFQFLTKEGQELLIKYRDEAIDVMKTCSSNLEFRQKLLQQYGVPYSLQGKLITG